MRLLIAGCLMLSGCAKHGAAWKYTWPSSLRRPTTIRVISRSGSASIQQEGPGRHHLADRRRVERVLEALLWAGACGCGRGASTNSPFRWRRKGAKVVTFISLARSPNVAVIAAAGGKVKALQDLRGKTVGVSSAGSPSQFYLNHLLTRSGVQPTDVSIASVGMGATTAVAALEHQQVDAATALRHVAITTLEARHPDLIVLADARTPEGLRAVFGVDDYPASSLLAKESWLKANSDAARRMTRAVRAGSLAPPNIRRKRFSGASRPNSAWVIPQRKSRHRWWWC